MITETSIVVYYVDSIESKCNFVCLQNSWAIIGLMFHSEGKMDS